MENLHTYSFDDKTNRFELINGKIVMMSPYQKISHARICINILTEFGIHLKHKSCEIFGYGTSLFLDEHNHFIPDIMITFDKNIIKDDYIAGAPDLIVEVLSLSTAKKDRFSKKISYERAGVKEYWLVDPIYKNIEVYLYKNRILHLNKIYYYLTEEELASNEYISTIPLFNLSNQIKVSICDNLTINLRDIFDNV